MEAIVASSYKELISVSARFNFSLNVSIRLTWRFVVAVVTIITKFTECPKQRQECRRQPIRNNNNNPVTNSGRFFQRWLFR